MDLARYDELLSAFLDRELSPDERAAVDRLLEQSSEARERLHELQVTSRFMRSLPQHQLTADFSDNVIDRLRSESLLRPEPVAPKPTIHRNIWWYGTPLAAAATLLFALSIRNYQNGNRDMRPAASPFDDGVSKSVSSEALSAIASITQDQWEAGDVVEIRGPTGEKQFELLVLAMAAEPNTTKCILAESQDLESAKSDSVALQSAPAVAQDSTAVTIVADQEQIEQLHRLLAQSDDGSGTAFPLVEIVTEMDPQRIRVAAVGLETRSAGIQAPLAARESSRRDESTEPADPAKGETLSTVAANQQGDSSTARRIRGTPPPTESSPVKEERKANATARASALAESDTAQLAKKVPAGPSETSKIAEALQNRGQQAPVRMKQLDIRQQSAGAPAAVTATTQQPSTADQVEKLKKVAERERAEPPRARVFRQDDKEPPRRHKEVLLIIRNDPPE